MSSVPASVRLGEVDLSAIFDFVYQQGELLACINAAGGLLAPGFMSAIGLTMPLGKWGVRDPASVQIVTAETLTPEQAAHQFSEYEGELLQALLAGYGRKAYQVLEPRYPGFTEQVVSLLLPPPVPQVTKPRPVGYDLGHVLQAYGAVLEFDCPTPPGIAKAQLGFAVPAIPATPPTDEELVLASVILFAGRLPLTLWLTQVAACEPARELAQLFGALARGELHESSWSGLLPRLLGSERTQRKLRARLARQPWPLNLLLSLLGEAYVTPDHLATLYEQRQCFPLLRATLDQLPPGAADPPAPRGVWLASIMDGLDYLALQADAQGRTHASIEFAQASTMALQLLPCLQDPGQAEAWLSRVEAQQYRYSWRSLSPSQPLEKSTVWRFVSYVSSVRLVAEAFGEAAGEWYTQGKVRNQLWSAIWYALEGLRQGLRLCYALAQQHALTSKEDRQKQGLQVKALLDHYLRAQRQLAAMIQRNQQQKRDVSLWVQALVDEEPTPWERTQVGGDMQRAEAVRAELHPILLTDGYNLEVHKRLAELVASLTEEVVTSRRSTAGQQAYTPDYCQEEDQVYHDVLAELLWQRYIGDVQAQHLPDGEPIIPPPAAGLSAAEKQAYYEAYVAAHPEKFTPPEVLNLAPRLRSMAECRAEYESLLEQPNLPVRTQALQQLLQEPVLAHLVAREFTPASAPPVEGYTLYWRYEPFHQYPEPLGSWGQQLGMQFSRVCLNSARDSGFFFYEVDYNQYALGSVMVVRKQQGRWVLQQEA
ncbi:hypothetical protein MTX78_15145 [Hymenobacter tibetensis]|uniref:Uncharacterized protein n=1 Tax=Hymenobacter tibetensis TaxID=497967 RepID=A0ABY4CT69_9BACT|nr:hypothetical protein [Hymenobacter tibetensis]UOG73460.1 hypothetical protein MTX78_15145 [Hymenobacter tibetensis]